MNDTWVDETGDLLYWDGANWASYADPPEWPGGDPDPKWLEREA
jgi:hypothetical protein